MISERVLRKWRKDALVTRRAFIPIFGGKVPLIIRGIEKIKSMEISIEKELSDRVLVLTQELLDQHLLRRKS